MLCFAVLWVLGIAYYFYSGTALSRKVGFPFPTAFPPFSPGYMVRVGVRGEVFFQDKAKMERCGSALLSLFSPFLGARGFAAVRC